MIRRWYFLTFVQNFMTIIIVLLHDGHCTTIIHKHWDVQTVLQNFQFSLPTCHMEIVDMFPHWIQLNSFHILLCVVHVLKMLDPAHYTACTWKIYDNDLLISFYFWICSVCDIFHAELNYNLYMLWLLRCTIIEFTRGIKFMSLM